MILHRALIARRLDLIGKAQILHQPFKVADYRAYFIVVD